MPPGGSNFPQTKGTSMRNIPLPACFAVDRVWNRTMLRALELYTASAQQDFPYAAYELGKMYRDGIGCEKDAEASEQWYRQAFCRISRIGTAEP